MRSILSITLGWLVLIFTANAAAAAWPVQITDSSGHVISFSRPPERVACLAPHITQILVDLGRSDHILALTRQDLVFHASLRKTNLGSYFTPDIPAIERAGADLVIATPRQAKKFGGPWRAVSPSWPWRPAQSPKALTRSGRWAGFSTVN